MERSKNLVNLSLNIYNRYYTTYNRDLERFLTSIANYSKKMP